MRWLMPFDGTWFYGDALYIVDPWMWLIAGSAAFLRFSTSRRAVTSWIVLGLLLSLPIFLFDTSLSTGILWTAVLLSLAAVRLRGPVPTGAAQAACLAALALATAYVVGMMALQHQAHAALVNETGKRPAEVFVGPLPARVDGRDVLLVEQHAYTPGVYLIGGEFATSDPIAVESEDTRAFAALITPCAQGIADWLRFPFFRIEELDGGGSLVHLLDARYVRSAKPGFGMWTVEFDADRRVVGCP
jgi:inner membrane protein